MGIIDKIRRKKVVDPDERRQLLLINGRITDGVIIDSEMSSTGREIVVYAYTLNGVDFESSDTLTDEQSSTPIKYVPGARVGIRYDQRNQGNSVIE